MVPIEWRIDPPTDPNGSKRLIEQALANVVQENGSTKWSSKKGMSVAVVRRLDKGKSGAWLFELLFQYSDEARKPRRRVAKIGKRDFTFREYDNYKAELRKSTFASKGTAALFPRPLGVTDQESTSPYVAIIFPLLDECWGNGRLLSAGDLFKECLRGDAPVDHWISGIALLADGLSETVYSNAKRVKNCSNINQFGMKSRFGPDLYLSEVSWKPHLPYVRKSKYELLTWKDAVSLGAGERRSLSGRLVEFDFPVSIRKLDAPRQWLAISNPVGDSPYVELHLTTDKTRSLPSGLVYLRGKLDSSRWRYQCDRLSDHAGNSLATPTLDQTSAVRGSQLQTCPPYPALGDVVFAYSGFLTYPSPTTQIVSDIWGDLNPENVLFGVTEHESSGDKQPDVRGVQLIDPALREEDWPISFDAARLEGTLVSMHVGSIGFDDHLRLQRALLTGFSLAAERLQQLRRIVDDQSLTDGERDTRLKNKDVHAKDTRSLLNHVDRQIGAPIADRCFSQNEKLNRAFRMILLIRMLAAWCYRFDILPAVDQKRAPVEPWDVPLQHLDAFQKSYLHQLYAHAQIGMKWICREKIDNDGTAKALLAMAGETIAFLNTPLLKAHWSIGDLVDVLPLLELAVKTSSFATRHIVAGLTELMLTRIDDPTSKIADETRKGIEGALLHASRSLTFNFEHKQYPAPTDHDGQMNNRYILRPVQQLQERRLDEPAPEKRDLQDVVAEPPGKCGSNVVLVTEIDAGGLKYIERAAEYRQKTHIHEQSEPTLDHSLWIVTSRTASGWLSCLDRRQGIQRGKPLEDLSQRELAQALRLDRPLLIAGAYLVLVEFPTDENSDPNVWNETRRLLDKLIESFPCNKYCILVEGTPSSAIDLSWLGAQHRWTQVPLDEDEMHRYAEIRFSREVEPLAGRDLQWATNCMELFRRRLNKNRCFKTAEGPEGLNNLVNRCIRRSRPRGRPRSSVYAPNS